LQFKKVSDPRLSGLAILLRLDLRQPPPDRGMANVHAFADVPDLALFGDHPNHFQFQAWIE